MSNMQSSYTTNKAIYTLTCDYHIPKQFMGCDCGHQCYFLGVKVNWEASEFPTFWNGDSGGLKIFWTPNPKPEASTLKIWTS